MTIEIDPIPFVGALVVIAAGVVALGGFLVQALRRLDRIEQEIDRRSTRAGNHAARLE